MLNRRKKTNKKSIQYTAKTEAVLLINDTNTQIMLKAVESVMHRKYFLTGFSVISCAAG